MAKGFNSVTLVGRLVKDPELRNTSAGDVAGFTLAVDKLKDGTDFFDVNAWNKLAELVSQYTHKGSQVLVSGRLSQQTWEQEGQKRSKVVVVAHDVMFLEPKSADTSSKTDKVAPVGDEPINLDDIPF